jgi:predicted nucleotidyltransferase component of viral defense system
VYEISRKTGFQLNMLEKSMRLYYVLKDMSENPLLRDNFALKGGTAINFAYFNLPRLSVDIDMDFTMAGKMRDLLPLRKEIKDTIFDMLGSQGYTVGREGKELHILDQWTFNYRSAGGNNDHIKFDLNYGARNHILPVENKDIKLEIVSDNGISIQTLNPCELFASKINALIDRATVRDLFDVYNLSRSNLLSSPEEKEMLRKSIVFYHSIGGEGKVKKEIDLHNIMEIEPSTIRSQLVPMLPSGSGRKYFPIEKAQENAMQYLKAILTLTPKECEYMENMCNNIYKPELLFQDSAIVGRIAEHPMVSWRIQQSRDKDFQEAIKNKDFIKISGMKNEGYKPSENLLKDMQQSGSITKEQFIAVEKIFDLPANAPK